MKKIRFEKGYVNSSMWSPKGYVVCGMWNPICRSYPIARDISNWSQQTFKITASQGDNSTFMCWRHLPHDCSFFLLFIFMLYIAYIMVCSQKTRFRMVSRKCKKKFIFCFCFYLGFAVLRIGTGIFRSMNKSKSYVFWKHTILWL